MKCTQCSYCSNKFDPFLGFSLEIIRADSLLKALSHYTTVEQLDGGVKRYQCEQCKVKVNALKQLKIDKAPHVLGIHLKCFSVVGSGGKIDKKVDFGCTLDLKPFVSSSHVSSPYNIIFQWITFSMESNNIVFVISTGFLINFAHLNDNLVSLSIDQSQGDNFKYTLYVVLGHDG